ncbi:hypothetical protein [Dactylosporangium darangshiense]|uniref:Uncharacterized protein n=1 Tax=Dactylosporangium darangshiense TaxID=579108 RepID=A0ABP8D8T3_9ACTN
MPTVRPRTARRLTVAGAALTLLTAGIAAAWPAEASLTVPSGWTVAWSDDSWRPRRTPAAARTSPT